MIIDGEESRKNQRFPISKSFRSGQSFETSVPSDNTILFKYVAFPFRLFLRERKREIRPVSLLNHPSDLSGSIITQAEIEGEEKGRMAKRGRGVETETNKKDLRISYSILRIIYHERSETLKGTVEYVSWTPMDRYGLKKKIRREKRGR